MKRDGMQRIGVPWPLVIGLWAAPAAVSAQSPDLSCPPLPTVEPVRHDAAAPDAALAMRLGAVVVLVRSNDELHPVLRDATVRIWGPRGDVRSLRVDSGGQVTILRRAGVSRVQVRRLGYKAVEVRVPWRPGYRDTLRIELPVIRLCLHSVTTNEPVLRVSVHRHSRAV